MLNTTKFILLKDGHWHDSADTQEEMLQCFIRAVLSEPRGKIAVLKVDVSAVSLKGPALWNVCDVMSSTGSGLS